MAGKRRADSELNHDNWNDYEPEEAGSFQQAPEDVLKERVIRVARRRRPIDETGSSTKNVFSNFGAFAKKSTTDSPFTFLANLTNDTNSNNSNNSSSTNTNGLNNFTAITTATTSTSSFKQPSATSSTVISFKPLENIPKPTENGTSTTLFTTKPPIQYNPKVSNDTAKQTGITTTKSNDYYANLKGLNESVSQWIKIHVDKNPFCILTPIFKDYEKYLKEIDENANKDESKEQNKMSFTSSGGAKPSISTVATSHSASIFGQSITKSSESSIFGCKTESAYVKKDDTSEKSESTRKTPEKPVETVKPVFNVPTFNSTNTAPATTIPSSFTFGSTTSSFTFGKTTTSFGSAPSGFSFSSNTPFTFSNVAKPPSDKKEDEEKTEEEDEPPKVEFVPVVEEDHVFSKRCKVFVKKDGNFIDRGVGQLFLKPVSGSEKVQLIVRADTNLGNLLLNFILSESIPTQRMGKNNVMLVTLPMPDAKLPPVPVLLRVKTTEEADELLKILEKHKK